MKSPTALTNLGHIMTIVVPAFLMVLLPFIHIGIINARIWVPDKPAVNKKDCTCSCFDTIFKGSYENPRGRLGYKHVYFNATINTLKIWGVTVLFSVLFYESVKYLLHIYRTSQLSRPWLVLYLVNVYPHYYSWWSFFSYWNDDYYGIFYHHLFFTATEIISTALVASMCDAAKQPVPWKLFTVIVINAVHMVAAGFDQFIAHVIQGQGHTFHRSRDLGLMMPDVLHIAIAAYMLRKLNEKYATDGRGELIFSRKNLCLLGALSGIGTISCLILRYN